jgi:hypothetical protein
MDVKALSVRGSGRVVFSQVLELRYGGQRARLQRVGSLIESYLLGEVRHASAMLWLVISSRLHPTPAC